MWVNIVLINEYYLVIRFSKTTGKRPLGRRRRRWEDNITMDLKEIGINTRN